MDYSEAVNTSEENKQYASRDQFPAGMEKLSRADGYFGSCRRQ
jgi:hypothetical protein